MKLHVSSRSALWRGPGPLGARLLLVLLLGLSLVEACQAQSGDALRARYQSLGEQLSRTAFQAPLVLDSQETKDSLKGEVYARIQHPFQEVQDNLKASERWCELLILHLNVKLCRNETRGSDEFVNLVIGRKHDQPLEDGYRFAFNYRVAAATAQYLRVEMSSDDGPVGTRAYRLFLEAIPIDAGSSFVHFSYAYSFGTMARVAMQGYLMTLGRDKVGFTVIGTSALGKPVYIGGVRGVVERNTMRYYLAIETYLDAVNLPAAARQEKRLDDWFRTTELYPTQLHEMTREEYLVMKRREIRRQQTMAAEARQ